MNTVVDYVADNYYEWKCLYYLVMFLSPYSTISLWMDVCLQVIDGNGISRLCSLTCSLVIGGNGIANYVPLTPCSLVILEVRQLINKLSI